MQTKDTSQESSSRPKGLLGVIEWLGNKLPDPFWLFVILGILVLISSWIGEHLGMSAMNPSTEEEVHVENLLSAEGFHKIFTEAVNNFISFPPLGLILTVMLGIAVAEHSGLIGAAMRGVVNKVSPKTLTFTVALLGVTGSIASDAVYVILIPLGAAAFKQMGRSPVVGAMVAFAASSAGFNASLILNITDVLLAGISTSAASMIDPEYEVGALANYFFVIPSAIVLALIITVVTELFMYRRTHELVDHDDVDYEAASFTRPTASHEDEEDVESEDVELTLQPHEKRGMRWASVVSIVVLAAYFAFLFIPGSPMRGEGGSIIQSPLITGVAVAITVFFLAAGIAYGLGAGTISSGKDVPEFMAEGLKTLLPMLVLFFVVAQFIAYFSWSNLGTWTAIKGSELLTHLDLPHPVLFLCFVLLVAVLNLLITSGSAQWALMAPIIVPMMLLVGVSPEVSQMLFRIGDSPTNIITPMSPYFALALTFLQRYHKNAGVGTLMSLAIPYSVSMLLGWFVFFLVWYFLGIPLGPGVPIR
ncbi:AbgT family transporter [Corynebacterium uropygiale]|uniref:AbgT family transporter n=1 Tax=Corynebacterium uropygiale TaxID=1775911 RepID=A0A9X1QU52_9CORY|nr:AbgT family transporter [Corynebacterium uropygiale]